MVFTACVCGLYFNPESRISFSLIQKVETGKAHLTVTQRGTFPMTLLRLMLELTPLMVLFAVFLFRKAAMVTFYMDTGKLRHNSFPKTPRKSAIGEGFPDSYRQ